MLNVVINICDYTRVF